MVTRQARNSGFTLQLLGPFTALLRPGLALSAGSLHARVAATRPNRGRWLLDCEEYSMRLRIGQRNVVSLFMFYDSVTVSGLPYDSVGVTHDDGRESMGTPTLTDSQVAELFRQLPTERRQESLAYAESRLRRLSAERGLR